MVDDAPPPIDVPPHWALDEGGQSISIRCVAKDFLTAMDLLQEVGAIAEDQDHHPDLHLTGWNKVRISTWSHDVGRLTERDVTLATAITALLDARDLLPAADA